MSGDHETKIRKSHRLKGDHTESVILLTTKYYAIPFHISILYQ